MVPIADVNPTRRVPVMNLILIGINVLVFLYELQLSNRGLSRLVFQWGVIPQEVLFGIVNPMTPRGVHAFITLFTSQFLHANWTHIIGNMLFLYIFGDNIEDILGSIPYLIFYVVAGVVAGLTQAFLFAPFLGGVNIPSIGASGAIAGVLGAYLVLFPTTRVRAIVPPLFFLPFSVPAIIMIGLWFLLQFVSGVGSLGPDAAQSGGVAYWAHVGGFIAGVVMILPFWGRARQIKAQELEQWYAPSSYDRYR